jgi:hypothetical protein
LDRLRKSKKGVNLVLIKLELVSFRIKGINDTITVDSTVVLGNLFQMSPSGGQWDFLMVGMWLGLLYGKWERLIKPFSQHSHSATFV